MALSSKQASNSNSRSFQNIWIASVNQSTYARDIMQYMGQKRWFLLSLLYTNRPDFKALRALLFPSRAKLGVATSHFLPCRIYSARVPRESKPLSYIKLTDSFLQELCLYTIHGKNCYSMLRSGWTKAFQSKGDFNTFGRWSQTDSYTVMAGGTHVLCFADQGPDFRRVVILRNGAYVRKRI